jgi:hypothetical protein
MYIKLSLQYPALVVAVVIYLAMCVQLCANKLDLLEVGRNRCVLKQLQFQINCFGNYFHDKNVDFRRLRMFIYIVTSTDCFGI